ncbi:hypothetical protein ACQR1I_11715 [Bradyrhizobium sp. HKCCYLS2038]|uniref:hypothetical protein n=1 Tax=unclassified Bradyrhizobium TaxID=2631580 RepID=UPI003EBBD46F
MRKKAWTFDPSRLLPGDIVLERGSGWRSKGIAWADWGNYSHALLWLGNTDFIEAVGDGVRVISFARVVIRKPNRWRLLRLVEDPDAAAKAAAFARNMSHRKYDLKGALQTKAGGRRTPDPTKLFCSQLVAAAYAQAGISIVDGLSAQQVTPAALEHSTKLKIIDLPLQEVDPENAAPLDRDKGYKTTMMQQEMHASQAAFEAVSSELGKLTDPKNPDIPFPPGDLYGLFAVLAHQKETFGIEDTILAVLKEHDYFDLGTAQAVGAHLEMRSAVERLRASGANLEHRATTLDGIRATAASFEPTLLRYRQNAAMFQDIYAARKHPLWLQLSVMYRKYAMGIESIREIAAGAEVSDSVQFGSTGSESSG